MAKDYTLVGKFTSVYGIKGWLKVYSHTQPMENIFTYSPWYIQRDGQWQRIEVEASKQHGKGLIAKLKGIADRDQARLLSGVDIAIDSEQLPPLEAGEYYWSQLEKLNVYTLDDQLLGCVSHLLETGANDVIVVKGCAGSIDRRERLIPYLPEQVIKEINLEAGTLRVDWDPEF